MESRVRRTLPNSFSAPSRAVSASSPRSMRSWMLKARWPRISSSSSLSSGDFMPLLLFRGRVQDEPDRVDELRPLVALAKQLGLPGCGQSVVLRPLVRFADPPLRLQPPAFHQAVERGIERAGLDAEQVVGLRADGLTDAVAVLRTPLQRAKDEQVERALKQLEPAIVGRLVHGSRHSTAIAVDCLRLFWEAGSA